MAIIPQKSLFGWEEIEGLEDLERLRLVLDYMPDEKLVRILEKERYKGQNRFPVRGVWNSILAGIVFQHISIESLRRELQRNGQLRQMCGLRAVPTPSAYSRFLKKLLKHAKELEEMFEGLVSAISEILPDFGERLAFDGKALPSHAVPHKTEEGKKLGPDGRRDTDADIGVKEYRGQREDGTPWEKIVTWFGYRLHLIVDATYELPVAFEVTKASQSEVKQCHKAVDQTAKRQPELIERCQYFLADKGLDDGKLITKLWDEYRIKPVIDIRNMWKDGEETKLVSGKTNVVFDYKGTVYCYDPVTGLKRAMAYGGFEANRETLKYRCPAQHYGVECAGKCQCPVKGAVRINLEEDRRVFTPLARSSYKWKEEYKGRTAIERVNSRLDVSFGFENHYIRGLKKMKARVGLALCVMLAMAIGRIKENQIENMRSLVKAV